MVLHLHNRYRTMGGEERTVEALRRLTTERLGEQTALLTRDSQTMGRARAAAGLVAGGLRPTEVAQAVRNNAATLVHAHNVNPDLGWRALAAARAAGAAVVLHLHNYRLVCAVGTCFTDGSDCVRCRGTNTFPGVRHRCRGSTAEALAYAAGLSMWQRRMVAQCTDVIVPSEAARERLGELRAPLADVRVHVLAPVLDELEQWPTPAAPPADGPALFAGRLAPEKGVEIAIDACAELDLPLWIAGDGPHEPALRARAAGRDVRFLGRLSHDELAGVRRQASVVVVPSRSAETFGLAAAEALAAGVPVAASAIGALPELVDADGLAHPGDAGSLAAAIDRVRGDRGSAARGRQAVLERCTPEVTAPALAAIYDRARAANAGSPDNPAESIF